MKPEIFSRQAFVELVLWALQQDPNARHALAELAASEAEAYDNDRDNEGE